MEADGAEDVACCRRHSADREEGCYPLPASIASQTPHTPLLPYLPIAKNRQVKAERLVAFATCSPSEVVNHSTRFVE